jgi:hypothetical protein
MGGMKIVGIERDRAASSGIERAGSKQLLDEKETK